MKDSRVLFHPVFVGLTIVAFAMPCVALVTIWAKNRGTPEPDYHPPIYRPHEPKPEIRATSSLLGHLAQQIKDSMNEKAAEIVDANGQAFEYKPPDLQYPEEVFLELIYLLELKRHLIYTGKPVPPRIEERIGVALAEAGFDGEVKFEIDPAKSRYAGSKTLKHPYVVSYTQWYALLIYMLREVIADWQKGGAADKLLDELVSISHKWDIAAATGRSHFDGSVASTALYVCLYLYVNKDMAAGAVSTALGTTLTKPEDNQDVPNPNNRRIVILLQNVCKKIDELYPEFAGSLLPATARLRYDNAATDKEGRIELAGGKALYYLARASLKLETRTKDAAQQAQVMTEVESLRDRTRDVILYYIGEQLQRDKDISDGTPLFDAYDFVYLMRAVTMYIRTYGEMVDSVACGEMVQIAGNLRAIAKKRGMGLRWSHYFRPLAELQYLTEMGHTLRFIQGMERIKSPREPFRLDITNQDL